MPDEKPEWIKFRVWLEAGQTPRFIFPNGPYESRASVITDQQTLRGRLPGQVRQGGRQPHAPLREGKLPHIRIGEIKIAGPMAEPAAARRRSRCSASGASSRSRPSTSSTPSAPARIGARCTDVPTAPASGRLYDKRIAEQATPRQAALDTVKMILCSPSFLYFSEITQRRTAKLGPTISPRGLSYALWSAPPDRELLAAAAARKADRAPELRKQAARLLADDRVAASCTASSTAG